MRYINPDEDGKDEKYLMGGWHNRIALALTSDLPNEIDWAFNKLCKISYQPNFYIGYVPSLPEALLEHTNPFFDQIELKTSPQNFQSTVKVSPTAPVPPMQQIQLFNNENSSILIERTLQCLHILRNLSFMNENAIAFTRDHKVLTLLAKGMSLPSHTYYVEIKQHSIDIFENIARLVVLRGPSDFFLACIKKMVYEDDRGHLLGSLKALVKLAANEQNEKVILRIETPFLQRLLQLLLVPDEELVNVVMEFLYLFTSLSPEAGSRLATSVRFNVLTLFYKYLRWKNHGAQVKPMVAPKPIAPPTQPGRPAMDPRTLDHYFCAMW